MLSLVNALGMVAAPIGLSLMALLLTRTSLNVGALAVFVGFLGRVRVRPGQPGDARVRRGSSGAATEPDPEPTVRGWDPC